MLNYAAFHTHTTRKARNRSPRDVGRVFKLSPPRQDLDTQHCVTDESETEVQVFRDCLPRCYRILLTTAHCPAFPMLFPFKCMEILFRVTVPQREMRVMKRVTDSDHITGDHARIAHGAWLSDQVAGDHIRVTHGA